jgi:hypothetical protein
LRDAGGRGTRGAARGTVLEMARRRGSSRGGLRARKASQGPARAAPSGAPRWFHDSGAAALRCCGAAREPRRPAPRHGGRATSSGAGGAVEAGRGGVWPGVDGTGRAIGQPLRGRAQVAGLPGAGESAGSRLDALRPSPNGRRGPGPPRHGAHRRPRRGALDRKGRRGTGRRARRGRGHERLGQRGRGPARPTGSLGGARPQGAAPGRGGAFAAAPSTNRRARPEASVRAGDWLCLRGCAPPGAPGRAPRVRAPVPAARGPVPERPARSTGGRAPYQVSRRDPRPRNRGAAGRASGGRGDAHSLAPQQATALQGTYRQPGVVRTMCGCSTWNTRSRPVGSVPRGTSPAHRGPPPPFHVEHVRGLRQSPPASLEEP